MKKKRSFKWIAYLILAVTFSFALPAQSEGAIPKITRAQILSYAKTAVGSWYVWGGDKWDPNNRSWGGADCSGLIIKAWRIPYAAPYKKSVGHPYSTYHFYNKNTHWYKISRSQIKAGDSYVRRSNGAGHCFIFVKHDNWGKKLCYEAPRTGLKIRYISRGVSSSYIAIRRRNLKNSSSTGGTSPVAVPNVPNNNFSSLKVKEVTASALNVRTGPSTGYRIIGRVYRGQRYVTLSRSGKWYKIWFDGGTAWCHGGYLKGASGGTALKINVSGLNVRRGPSTGYGRVGVSHSPELYVVIGSYGKWRKIWFDGSARWVYAGNGYGSHKSY